MKNKNSSEDKKDVDIQKLLTLDELNANLKEIKFELEPPKNSQEVNMKPIQKNIIRDARNNRVGRIREMADKLGLVASDFEFYDGNKRTPLFEAVMNKNVEVVRYLV